MGEISRSIDQRFQKLLTPVKLDLQITKEVPEYITGDRMIFSLITGELSDIIFNYIEHQTLAVMSIGISGIHESRYILFIKARFNTTSVTSAFLREILDGEVSSNNIIREKSISSLLSALNGKVVESDVINNEASITIEIKLKP